MDKTYNDLMDIVNRSRKVDDEKKAIIKQKTVLSSKETKESEKKTTSKKTATKKPSTAVAKKKPSSKTTKKTTSTTKTTAKKTTTAKIKNGVIGNTDDYLKQNSNVLIDDGADGKYIDGDKLAKENIGQESLDVSYKLESGNEELDKKIAEYYRKKQEKINEYQSSRFDGKHEKSNEDFDAIRADHEIKNEYAEVFSSEPVPRESLLKEIVNNIEEIYAKGLETQSEQNIIDSLENISSFVEPIQLEEEQKQLTEEEIESMNLLGKDVALNEEDLLKAEEKPSENIGTPFYGSIEDNENKAVESVVEHVATTNEHEKEVGDINLNKGIGNAIPSSQIKINIENEQNQVAKKNEQELEQEVETIYTLLGIQTKEIQKEEREMKILYVASECQPFVASGGLADVAGSLPKAIAKNDNIDIRVILPLYGTIKNDFRDKFEYLGNFTVHLSWRQEYCGLFRYRSDNVTYYFVDNERYFKRDSLYGYYDDGERFAYFSKAVVEALPIIDFFPDIIHCNDWQSALVSTYIKTGCWSDFRYYKIKHVYTIHNVEYQGVYGMENLKDLFGIDYRFKNDMEYNNDINLTKAAIQFSDKFTTVSNSYCDNLKEPYCSKGLHHIILRNEYKLSGIINGVDYTFYHPSIDPNIAEHYDINSIDDKVKNKKVWQDELGLPVDGDTPMIAIVSRLAGHKGLDLVNRVMENIVANQDIQLVVVGTGEQKFVDYFKYLENKYPTKVRALVDKYSNVLGRKAYAASDIFLMPSMVEPCGISQMIASCYGSIPIVRETGGLKDTIKDFGCSGGGNGYTFANYNAEDMEYTINRAIKEYGDKEEWRKKMEICMSKDFSWNIPAQKYIDLYRSILI